MADGVQSGDNGQGNNQHGSLMQAVKVAQAAPLQHAPNGIRYAAYGQNNMAPGELERMVQAVPTAIAGALSRKAYYFIPLAMSAAPSTPEREHRGSGEETMIATAYASELIDQAICHRNVPLGSDDGVFISTRLLNDRFALAFEFFINVGHAFVEAVGVPEAFNKLVWDQALKDVRGETSQDAWESRGQSLIQARIGTADPKLHIDEKSKSDYLESAFSDAVAIYQLSLSVDFNYSELREREYPLLAPQPLAERLRLAAKLFPPNPGYEFSIRYRRRA
ncbi:hypothetical protein [Granulicella arctica]|uniref:Uncharacterized protein n=1 Tax=Granulicella arctica TaxID=940613 RepID=A0A7Y9PGH8_9BACT|nr:hypothetical protein [Granulicella arctica]NYF78708.1 hypothetical protein [Granulicella arctica]